MKNSKRISILVPNVRGARSSFPAVTAHLRPPLMVGPAGNPYRMATSGIAHGASALCWRSRMNGGMTSVKANPLQGGRAILPRRKVGSFTSKPKPFPLRSIVHTCATKPHYSTDSRDEHLNIHHNKHCIKYRWSLRESHAGVCWILPVKTGWERSDCTSSSEIKVLRTKLMAVQCEAELRMRRLETTSEV
eukprot:1195259-Prorocentrum_minimum.AAC.4